MVTIMGLVSWYIGKVKGFKELPTGQWFLFLTGKVFGAMAFGMLIVSYIKDVDWTTIGWIVMVFAFLMTLGPWLKVMTKK